MRISITVALAVCFLASCESPEEKLIASIDSAILAREEKRRAAAAERESLSGVSVLVETFEVSNELLSDFLQSSPLEEDAALLRRQIQIWAKSGNALSVNTSVASARVGRESKVSAMHRFVYPEKFTREKFSTLDASDKEMKSVVALTPARLTMHRVGQGLNVRAEINEEGQLAVTLSAEFSTRLPDQSWTEDVEGTSSTTWAPQLFRNEMATTLTVQDGAYEVLGTVSLPEEAKESEWSDAVAITFFRGDVW